MTKIDFLYGKGSLPLDIPAERLRGVLLSRAHDFKPEGSESELVRRAIENPINSPRLSELARGKKNIVLLASDHTRPVPSRVIFPLMIEEIRRGNPDAKVTIVISTGCHRPTTGEELAAKFGAEVVERYPIVIHDGEKSEVALVGTLPSGADLRINKVALEADLLIAEGFIEPHFFAGFSGGRKSVFPGVTNSKSVMANHCAAFIDHPKSRTGVLEGNPIHKDMVDAARQAKLAFIVNVVVDSAKKVIAAFAGHYDKAHQAGCAFVDKMAGVDAIEADIVITTNGGYPLDQNLYQAVKGMTAAEAACRKGGVIIMAARGEDGHGGAVFHETFKREKDLNRMMKTFLSRAAGDTIADQWQSQIFARVLMWATVIMVTEAPKEMVEDLHMKYAATLEEAMNMAEDIVGKNASITAIPDGIGVIVRKK